MDRPNDLMRDEESRKVSENQDWSKLCPDLLRRIIESLSSIDFYRAKVVCSDWYSVWKTCVKRRLCPWRIIYKHDSPMLLDPVEEKIYSTQYIGLTDKSYFMASSGNCLLMVDSSLDFYIFNLVTRKRINLPSMESPVRGAQVRFERRSSESGYRVWGHFVEPCRKDRVSEDITGRKRSAVLWTNEETGDYVVAWIFNNYYLFTHKKGDDSWWNWNMDWETKGTNLGYLDLAYKNSKLYLYTSDDHIKIIDFSGDLPKEEIEKNPYMDHPFHHITQGWEHVLKWRIAIQKSGEVLIIWSVLDARDDEQQYLFYVFKLNFESGEWERVYSIGDGEMLIFGHGVTIRAPVQDVGDEIKNGSICFVVDDLLPGFDSRSYSGVFDLATSRIDWSKKFRFDTAKSQWFVPGFA